MPSDNDVPTVKPAWMSPIETRQERADCYFRTVLDGQRERYDKNAGKQKRRYLAFAICVIVLGALISLLQVLDTAHWWVRHLTAAVAISRAVDALLRPGETWQGYRKASEGMKREYRLYLNNADAYAAAQDEAAAYRLLGRAGRNHYRRGTATFLAVSSQGWGRTSQGWGKTSQGWSRAGTTETA